MAMISNCNDPALLTVYDVPAKTVRWPRFEIYINGFKEGEVHGDHELHAVERFWNMCSDHNLIARKLRGEVQAIVERIG